MKALVIGGTGKVGGATVAQLRAAGVETIAAGRQGGDVSFDMRDSTAVTAAARGCDAAFFMTPLGPDEAAIGLGVHAALIAAGVPRIGYLAIHNLDAMRAIPHFEAKRPIRDAVLGRRGGVVVAPNFFFQNDLLVLDAIMSAGVYPLPIGSVGVHSVDVADIGRASARVLMSDAWDGAVVPVCGRERMTGPALAADWTVAAGRAVAYGGDAIAPVVAMLAHHLPGFGEWERVDFTAMLAVTQQMGCLATDADIALSQAAIGQPATLHLEFAQASRRPDLPTKG